MKNWLITLAFMAAACAGVFTAVLKFNPLNRHEHTLHTLQSQMRDNMHRTPSHYNPNMVYQQKDLYRSSKLLSYSWKNCGNTSAEHFIINNITFAPDPLSFPGTLIVAFNINITLGADAPVKATLLLEKKIESVWIEIPCIGEIGSCSYDDICVFLQDVQCPPELVEAKIPCKCPFPKGSYDLQKASFEIDGSFLPTGDYRLKATLSYKNVFGGCYDFYASIE